LNHSWPVKAHSEGRTVLRLSHSTRGVRFLVQRSLPPPQTPMGKTFVPSPVIGPVTTLYVYRFFGKRAFYASRARHGGRRNWPKAVPRKVRGRKKVLTEISEYWGQKQT
jgi:hypothetical protein